MSQHSRREAWENKWVAIGFDWWRKEEAEGEGESAPLMMAETQIREDEQKKTVISK